jgi:hypothetical protein
LAIVDICSIAPLDTLGDGAASVVTAVLADGGGAELLVAAVREFTMVAVLVGDRSSELLVVVLTGCVDGIGGASCSALLSSSHVEAALVVDLVGAGSLGAGVSVALGTGLLAVWSSVRFSVKAASVIAGVVGAKSLVVVFPSWVDAVG